VKTLREGGVPNCEDHLPELLARHLGHGVEFTTDLGSAVKRSEAIFIVVDTPQRAASAADLSYVEAAVSEIARSIDDYKVIVEKSTAPVYTNGWICRMLHRYGADSKNFDVVSNPESLREGTAIVDFLHRARIVVGASSERSADVLRRIYEPLTGGTLSLASRMVSKRSPCSRSTFSEPNKRRRAGAVPAVALAAHRWRNSMLFEYLTEVLAGVLAAAITMKPYHRDDSRSRSRACFYCRRLPRQWR